MITVVKLLFVDAKLISLSSNHAYFAIYPHPDSSRSLLVNFLLLILILSDLL